MAVWRGPGGTLIEVIVLDSRPCLRVSQVVNGRRYHVGYWSIRELAAHVDLADLVEVTPFPSQAR
jgi:hypothetical protein